MTGRALLSLVALLTLAGGAFGQTVYQWVDEGGNLHFGESPPPGARDVRPWKAEGRDRLMVVPGAAGRAVHRRAPSRKTAPNAEPSRIEGKTESDWRREGRGYEGRIESLEEQIETEESRTASGWTSTSSSMSFDARKKARLEDLALKLELAEQAQEDFEDRARVAGVLPGWLR